MRIALLSLLLAGSAAAEPLTSAFEGARLAALESLSWGAHAEARGELRIARPLFIQMKRPDDCRDSDPRPSCIEPIEQTLEPGGYRTDVQLSRRELLLTIRGNDRYASVSIPVPQSRPLPDNGEFRMTAAEIGQEWPVSGTVKTTVTDGPERNDYESCTITREEWVCRGRRRGRGDWDRDRGDRDRERGRDCRWERVTYRGERPVSYFDRTTATELAFETGGLAAFSGSGARSHRVYTYRGECR